MFKEYIVVLLIGHFLGDFYFQTSKMAEDKEINLKKLFLHGLYYWGAMVLASLPIFSWRIMIMATLASVLHFFIDLVKFIYLSSIQKKSNTSNETKGTVYLLDQLLHFFCLGALAFWAVKSSIRIDELDYINEFFTVIGTSEFLVATWILSILIIGKPANITIQKVLKPYKPTNDDPDKDSDKKAGRLIGTVERITMLVLLSVGQYSAIGLVLTAKSIARYDKIAHESEFAEYYLLGTLLSTLIVILASFLLKLPGRSI